MQQGRSPPRGVLVLGISGLVGFWLLNTPATAQPEALSNGRSDGQSTAAMVPEGAPIDPAIESAVAEIEALGEFFARLSETVSDPVERATRAALAQTYADAATTLRRWAAAGELRIADLPPGIEAVIDRDAVIIGRKLAGRLSLEAAGADTVRLAQVLLDMPQASGLPAAGGRWQQVHEARLANVAPRVLEELRPYLNRYWHLQDAYLAVRLTKALATLATEGPGTDLSTPALEPSYQELLANVRATSAAAGDILAEDWSTYRAQVADLIAAAPTSDQIALDRLFSPAGGPPATAEALVDRERVADLHARLSALSNILAVRDREAAQTRAHLRALQDNLEELATRDEKQRTAAQALVAQVEAGRQALDRARTDAEARQTEIVRRLAASNAGLADLQSGLEGVTETLDTALGDLDALQAQVDELRKAQAAAAEGDAERNAQRAQRLSTLEREIRSLTVMVERVEDLARRQSTLAAKIEALRAGSAARAETLTQFDERLAVATTLRAELDATRQKLRRLETDVRSADVQREELAKGLAGVEKSLTAQETLAGTLQSETTAIIKRLDELSTRVDENAPSEALDELEGMLGALQQQVASQGEALRAETQRLTALDASFEQSVPRLQAQQTQIDSLFRALDQQADSLSQLDRDLSQALARLDDLDTRLAQKVDRDELANRLAAVRQGAERQTTRIATQDDRISDLEQQIVNLDSAAGELKEYLANLESSSRAEIAALRLRVDDVDKRVANARWAAMSVILVAALSVIVALALAGRLISRWRATSAAAQHEERKTAGTAVKRPPVTEPPPPEALFTGPRDDDLVTQTRKANAQRRRLEAIDALLTNLAFAVYADREKAAAVRRDLATAQQVVQEHARKTTRYAAELETLRQETVALATNQRDLRTRAKVISAELKTLQATRRKLSRLNSNVDTLRRDVRRACRRLLTMFEAAKEIPGTDRGGHADMQAEEFQTGSETSETKCPAESLEKEHVAPPLHEGAGLSDFFPICELDEPIRGRAIDAIRRADLKAFVRDFAMLTNLPQSRIGLLLFTGDGRDLAIACRAAGIAKAHFAALFIIARRSRSENRNVLINNLARAIRCFESMSGQIAVKQLQDWRAETNNDRVTASADH